MEGLRVQQLNKEISDLYILKMNLKATLHESIYLFLWDNFACTALYWLDLHLNFSIFHAAPVLVPAYEQSSSSKRQSLKFKPQGGTKFQLASFKKTFMV